jgi:multiple sugar transport system permease protein/sn-glycerol 3-phosphate transport system permease protein
MSTATSISTSPTTAAPAERKPAVGHVVGRIVLYLLLVLVAVVAILPVYWLISSSVKPSGEVHQFPPNWFPMPWTWELGNYVEAWNAAPFGRLYINSIVFAVVGTAGEIAIAILSAYAFAFLRFPAKNVVFMVFLGAMMVPGTVVLMPNYLTVASLGWVNSYAGLIVPGLGSVFAMFLLRQHMRTLPLEVTEAAKVDGASHLRILWSVILPMSRPMVATVVIISLVQKWNEFIWPLIVTTTDTMRTLPVGLLMLKSDEGYVNYGVVMAASVFVVVPVLVVFFLAQRQIIAGLTAGATKG